MQAISLMHRVPYLCPFFRATPPYYPACIAVMNYPYNAKVVPNGSAELGERIHIHTIARNAGEPSEKPKFPRLYWPKKALWDWTGR